MTAGYDEKPTISSKRQRRKIRFHERVQFKTIRHVSEFSDEEIKNGWYDKDDFNRMSENVSEIAKLISDGETRLNGEELCTRGLEHIVEEELADYRAEKMINSIDAVLDEQEEQWDEGKEEPGLIAELYAEYAKPLLREAHLIGLKDAEQGYKDWNDLMNDKQYKHLAMKSAIAPPLTDSTSSAKIEKEGIAKNMKKVQKSEDSSHERQHDYRRTTQAITSSNNFNTPGGTKEKKKKDQSHRDKNTKQHVPASSNFNNSVVKAEKEDSQRPKEKKKKVKRSRSQQSEGKDKNKNSTASLSCTDDSFSSSSSLSSSSLHLQKNHGSSSSINSCTLNETSMHSIMEEFDTIAGIQSNSSKGKARPSILNKNNALQPKSNTMSLKSKGGKPKLQLQRNGEINKRNGNKSISLKKQRKTQPRRSAIDRKYGTELSPFVFRRDGTLTFRKPDMEKLKKEQKEKRKNCIRGSLTKFLHEDDDEDDILAGILSKK